MPQPNPRASSVTDLWWNYPADAPAAWKFGMDRIYRPVYNGLMKQPGWRLRRIEQSSSSGTGTSSRRATTPSRISLGSTGLNHRQAAA